MPVVRYLRTFYIFVLTYKLSVKASFIGMSFVFYLP